MHAINKIHNSRWTGIKHNGHRGLQLKLETLWAPKGITNEQLHIIKTMELKKEQGNVIALGLMTVGNFF